MIREAAYPTMPAEPGPGPIPAPGPSPSAAPAEQPAWVFYLFDADSHRPVISRPIAQPARCTGP